MYWRVWLVPDNELADEWAIVEFGDGEFMTIAQQSAAQREPGRITTEVMEELARLGCPPDPPTGPPTMLPKRLYSVA